MLSNLLYKFTLLHKTERKFGNTKTLISLERYQQYSEIHLSFKHLLLFVILAACQGQVFLRTKAVL